MTIKSSAESIFCLPDILYATTGASNEVDEVSGTASDILQNFESLFSDVTLERSGIGDKIASLARFVTGTTFGLRGISGNGLEPS